MSRTKKRFRKKQPRSKQRRMKPKVRRTRKGLNGGEFDDNLTQMINSSLQNRDVNYAKMLQLACKNTGTCIALGVYGEKLKQYFDYFRDWNYVDNANCKKIGAVSANGFVIEIPFKKNIITAYTVLKCSASQYSDNLYYEFYVGKYFLNKYLKKLPTFVETYDLYQFLNQYTYQQCRERLSNLSLYPFKSNIKLNLEDESEFDDIGLINSCIKNQLNCVLIQHFDNFITFTQAQTIYYDNCKYDLYTLMYQVYFALTSLNTGVTAYTHYDLHTENVCLYKPFAGNKCILMRYHDADGTLVEFKSEYIAKIIDYGRNYFRNDITSTNAIVQRICGLPACGKNYECGRNFGYEVLKGEETPGEFYWVNPVESNVSHDLRFVVNAFGTNWLNNYDIIYLHQYGTPSIEDVTAQVSPITGKRLIKNIFEMTMVFRDIINNGKMWRRKYESDSSWTVAATMDIYSDGRDYEFNILPEQVPMQTEAPASSIVVEPSAPSAPSAPSSVTPIIPVHTASPTAPGMVSEYQTVSI